MDPKAFVYVAMSGEQVRGAPGAVWVDSANSIAKYLKLEEPFRIIIKTQERNLKDYIFSDYFFNNAFEKFEKNCSN